MVVSQNFIRALPPSVGLCRRLHTLNVDENDLDALPKEVGSCAALKILSAHKNHLSALPAELDHISELAVLNLTGNLIQHLPVSFMKLRKVRLLRLDKSMNVFLVLLTRTHVENILTSLSFLFPLKVTAIWLSQNQNKPLIQLNQDTDPETGQKVLTNFMLPQQPDDDNEAAASAGMARNVDNVSDNGSFHASVWEEERLKRSHVRWAGDRGAEEQQQQQQTMRGSSNNKEEDHQGGTAILQDQSTSCFMRHPSLWD